MYGYAAIIFRDQAFQATISELSKLVLFSSVVHQCMFTYKSSLPFSIGQVQDAGLIFLSTMASSIAKEASNPDAIIPTTLVALSLSTSLLGAVVYLIGKLKLAKVVGYLPVSVVGGYLGFIGYFCLIAGVSLSIGEDVSTVFDLKKIFTASNGVALVTPSIISGAFLAVISKRATSWLALPVSILIIPLLFYICMMFSGTSFAEAQQYGWLSKPTSSGPTHEFWNVWSLYDFSLVEWNLLPKQGITWLSMTFVVAFSSALDIVAIEMDMQKAINMDEELCTVGASNFVSGLLGGYTGSYIFSQTIFTFRTGCSSRLVGIVVILSELILFLIPINIMQFVPLYFFASTLIFIAFDLMVEWILEVRSKISIREYGVLMATFFIILFSEDLMLGIFVGIGLAILNFILSYSSVNHVESSGAVTSNVIRDFDKRRILADQNVVARINMHGFLFFGTAVQMVKKIQVLLNKFGDSESGTVYDAINQQDQVRYILIDFERVTGIDSTAVTTGFLRVKQLANVNGVMIAFSNLRPEFEELLIANQVILELNDPNHLIDCIVNFKETNDALEWIEDHILKQCSSPPANPSMPNIPFAFNVDGSQNKVLMSLSPEPETKIWLQKILVEFFGYDSENDGELGKYSSLTDHFGLMRFRAGDTVFQVGQSPDMIYIVLVGEIALYHPENKLIQRARYGSIVGDVHFCLSTPRQFNCVASEESAVFFLSRSRFNDLKKQDPRVALGFYACLAKSLAISAF